ncbi:MAG TPA: hypothetical protein VHB79_26055 [Polyangiaceae bacterium]|nr:hypothetical protein [Polyangiaceae bacterium]
MVKVSGKSACWLAWALAAAACGGESQHNPAGSPPEATGAGGQAHAGGTGVSKPGSGVATAGQASTSRGGSGGNGATVGGTATGGELGQPAGAAPEGGSPEGSGAGASDPGEGGSAGEPMPSCDPIVFDDPDFEYAVRASVNKPTGALTSADVVGLTFVAASGVKSIRGAECLTDLTDFDIGGLPWGDVSDLSPLAPLKKLETVDVGHNPLASVAPLGDLPQLKQLFMSSVPTSLDLAPLAGAPALGLLYLQKDTVVDLEPLGAVKTLVTLNLRQSTVLKPTGAAKLKSVLDLDATGVFDDVTPLAALTQLQKLRVGLKPTQGFAALATLKNLIFLDAQRASIADLAPLAGMTKLQQFTLSGNQVSDLTPLQSLAQLREAVLVDNQVQDLSPLVKNASFADGASLYVQKNPYDCAAQAANVSDLQGRGVEVFSDCQ